MSTNPYKVEWTIDLEAEGPKAAAEEAHLCQLENPPFFKVTNLVTGAVFEVDLDAEEAQDPTPLPLTGKLYWELYQAQQQVIQDAEIAIRSLKKRYIETLPVKVGDKVRVHEETRFGEKSSKDLYIGGIKLLNDYEPIYAFLKSKKDGSPSKIAEYCWSIVSIEKI
jgi:hypothetical protein